MFLQMKGAWYEQLLGISAGYLAFYLTMRYFLLHNHANYRIRIKGTIVSKSIFENIVVVEKDGKVDVPLPNNIFEQSKVGDKVTVTLVKDYMGNTIRTRVRFK